MAVQSTLRNLEHPLLRLLREWLRISVAKSKRSSKPARAAAVLALTLSIVLSAREGRRFLRRRAEEQARNHRLLRRNSGLKGKDGSRTIFVPYRSGTAAVTIHPTKPTSFDAHRRLFLDPPRAARMGDGQSAGQVPPPGTKPGLNVAFIHQFLSLLSIMIPHWNSKESGLLVSQGGFLLLRTYLSLVVTRLDGEIVRDLVAGNGRGFLWGIVKWCGIGGFASYTNAAIKFLQHKVAIAFRTRLTRYVHDLYLNDNLNYYKLLNLDGEIGQGVDQYICNDLTLLTTSAASLYSSIGKPLVDLCVFNYQLFRSLGPLALTGLLANYIVTATALRRLSPPFGKLKAVEARREGDFRTLHSRLIANAEEIAFYGGADIEKEFLDKGFLDLKNWMEGIYRLKIQYNMLEDFVLKYSWSAFGYLITALPVFLPEWGGLDSRSSSSSDPSSRQHSRMQAFITNKRLMLSLADAGGRMMYSLKDLSELAGHTSRVYTLISTLHRVHTSHYPIPRSSPAPPVYSLPDTQGYLHRNHPAVRFECVPVVAPAPTYTLPGHPILSPPLTFTINPNGHTLISGPNGTGKSAIPRLLAGLWPIYRGLVSRPKSQTQDGIMCIPQRPYLPLGTLRDQLIYPATAMDHRDAGRKDSELLEILNDVRSAYLPDREGGWDTRKDWGNVLSGGEKQRVAFARILYHEPRFAVLDEATSAISSDVEGLLYETLKDRGVTLVTISTRVSLEKYHDWNLRLGLEPEESQEALEYDSQMSEQELPSWEYEKVGMQKDEAERGKEIENLKDMMKQVEGWRRRKEEIERELAQVWEEGGKEVEAPAYVTGEGER